MIRVLRRVPSLRPTHSLPDVAKRPTRIGYLIPVRGKNHYSGLLAPTIGSTIKMMDSSCAITTDFSPPDGVKLATELDRDAFVKTVRVPSIRIAQNQLNIARKKLWKFVLHMPKMVPIRDYSPDEKVVLLDPKFVRSRDDCDDQIRTVVQELVGDYEKSFQVSELQMTYENWNADDVLKAVLPEGDNVSGFSIVGHLVHLNLRACHDPYKQLIGQVLLDKLKNIRTVVNKTDTIDNVYRFFKMELLAGEDDTVVTVKENGCSFQFDFAKVYWNSRLGTEHERIVNIVQEGDLVYDVFAGVGPFSVPCAKKGSIVLANDLNPESFRWLNENIKLNSSRKYPCKNIQTFNIDGREFIRSRLSEDIVQRSGFKGAIHVVMNLPALAVEFLDAFVGLVDDVSDDLPLPFVHCYTFSKAESDDHDFVEDVRRRAEAVLGSSLPSEYNIRLVRNVAPNKDMMCLKFRLTKAILQQEGPERKKVKLSDG